jgi:Flp pilus assembly protein TadD
VVEVAPDDTEAWMSLGDLYAASGDTAKSEQAYQRVIELEPANAHQIFFNLGALIINNPNRTDADSQKAIAAFRKAVELKPDYAQAHKQLAFALLGVGDRAGAKAALESYVELAPDAPDAAQMRAMINTLGK